MTIKEDQHKYRLRQLLDDWLKSDPARNSMWIKSGPVQVYMRKTPVVVAGRRWEQGLVIASISVNPRGDRRGYCRTILEWMSEQRVHILVAESVISDRMVSILERHDWHRDTPVEMMQWWKVPTCPSV